MSWATFSDAKLLNINKEEFIAKALKQPLFFAYRPQTLYEKEKIKEFFYNIKGEDYKLGSAMSISTYSENRQFTNILKYLVKQYYCIDANKYCDIGLLLKKTKSFTMTLPNHEILPKFEKFVEEFFEKNIGHKNYKILIKK